MLKCKFNDSKHFHIDIIPWGISVGAEYNVACSNDVDPEHRLLARGEHCSQHLTYINFFVLCSKTMMNLVYYPILQIRKLHHKEVQ